MFNYYHKVPITDASAAILDLVSSTRLAIMSGERGVLSGRVVVELGNNFALSIVNNSHAFEDNFEGAAILEVALLKKGRLVCDDTYGSHLTIVDGIDYHLLRRLFDRICEAGHYSIFNVWLECYRLGDSRYPEYEEPNLRIVRDYLTAVGRAVYA